MGISSLGSWDLAKSQAHPGASLPAQLEPWLMLPCLLQLLCPCHLCLQQGVHIPALCLDISQSPGLFLGGFYGYSCHWRGLSCSVGKLQSVLAFLITCLLLAAWNTHPSAAWVAACPSEVSLQLCILVTDRALS